MSTKNALVVFGLLAGCALPASTAHAQWTAGNYTVKTLVRAVGNYVYSSNGSGNGSVSAVATVAGSTIDVIYTRAYSAPDGTPDLVITPKTTLTGYGDQYSNCTSRATCQTLGSYSLSCYPPATYSTTYTFPYQITVVAPGASEDFEACGWAQSTGGLGSRGSTVVWFQ